jgi:hypothetical protein
MFGSQRIIIYLKVAFLAVLFSSCTELIDIEPENLAETHKFFKTEEDAYAIKSGMYNTFIQLLEQRYVLGECRANLVQPGPGAFKYGEVMEVFNHNISADNRFTDWELYYKSINQANDALEHFHEIKENDVDLEDKFLYGFILEAIWVRSFCYFELVRNFGDVPYITASNMDPEAVMDIEPTPADSILEQLIFICNLTHEWSDKYWDGSFLYWGEVYEPWQRQTASYGAVLALLIDIYAYQERHNKVLEVWERFNTQNNHWNWSHDLHWSGIPDDGWFYCVYVGGAENDPRGSFEVANVLTLDLEDEWRQWNIYAKYTSNVASHGGEYIVKPSNYAVNQWVKDGDMVRGLNKSYWIDTTSYPGRSDTIIWKFIGLDTTGTRREPYVSDANIIIKKTLDHTLKVCEAYNRLGMPEEAINIMDVYRNAIGHKALQVDGNIGMHELEEIIMEERAREFAFDGNYWYSLVRIARLRNDPNYLIDKIVSVTSDDRKNLVRANLQAGASGDKYNWWKLPYNSEVVARNKYISNE